MKRHLLPLFALSLFALAPLLSPGYFYSAHDGRHSVFFVTMFDEAVRSGALWPQWAMHHNQGYGYPTFLLQAPLAFYVAEVFVLLGFGITNAVKIAWALGFLVSAWGMYILVKYWILMIVAGRSGKDRKDPAGQSRQFASRCGLVAGLLYVYAPYRLMNVYVRAAFAETMLMAWFPWVFLAFDRLIDKGTEPGWQGRLLVAALSYAGLLLTHVFALLAFTPVLVTFILFRLWMAWRREETAQGEEAEERESDAFLGQGTPVSRLARRTALAACAGVAALLLAAIFILPLLVEGPLLAQEDWTRDTYDYTRHWVYWGQFLSPFWGYGFSDDPQGANDGMGFQLGVMHALLAVVAVYMLLLGPHSFTQRRGTWWKTPGDKSERMADLQSELHLLLLFLLLVSAGLLFIMTPAAAELWRRIPLLELTQFPWRLLALVTFSLSALGGLAVYVVGSEAILLPNVPKKDASALTVALLVCFAGFAYIWPESFQPVEPWREDGRAVMQFEQEHPDMLGYTHLVEERFTESPLTEQYLTDEFSNDGLERLGILAGEGEVLRHYSLGHAFGGEVTMVSPGTVQVRVYQFPGWQVRLDGKLVEHRLSRPYGLVELDVPAGRHRLDVWMGTTSARTAGAIITSLAFLCLISLWGYSWLRGTASAPAVASGDHKYSSEGTRREGK